MKIASFFYPVLLLALLASLSSCNPDSFSQIVDIDIPEHEPKPVLNLDLRAGDTIVSCLVSSSKGIIDTGEYLIPLNAKVRLLRNGQLISTLALNPDNGRYQARLASPLPDDAAEYRLEAELPGFEPVYAQQRMPAKPVITSASYRPDAIITPDGYRSDEVIVELEDPAGEENFYALQLIQYYGFESSPGDTTYFGNENFASSDDPNLVDGSPLGLVISDGAFNGRRYQLRVRTDFNDNPGSLVKLSVRLMQITREAYYYARSQSEYQLNVGNPFAEPITVFNNIQGGYGIFHLANGTERFLVE